MIQDNKDKLMYFQTVLPSSTMNKLKSITGESTAKEAIAKAVERAVNVENLPEKIFAVKWDNGICSGFLSGKAAERWVKHVFMKLVPDKKYRIISDTSDLV